MEEKKIPGLLQKIEFVKENISTICENHAQIKIIKGVVITKRHPPMSDYKDVKMIGVERINEL
jgi:hypothetical protein